MNVNKEIQLFEIKGIYYQFNNLPMMKAQKSEDSPSVKIEISSNIVKKFQSR